MFAVVFILVLAFVATWNAEPVFSLSERLDLPILVESIIILGLIGGIPALAVFLGVLLDTFTADRRRNVGGRRRAR